MYTKKRKLPFMMALYFPRDLVNDVSKKLVIKDIPSSIVHSWDNRGDEEITTIHKDYTDEEKIQCLAAIDDFMITIRQKARIIVSKMIAYGLTYHNVLRKDRQEFCAWPRARAAIIAMQGVNEKVAFDIMFGQFETGWNHVQEELLMTNLNIHYRGWEKKSNVTSGFVSKVFTKVINEKRKKIPWLLKPKIERKKRKKR